jgi:hypothetical protein
MALKGYEGECFKVIAVDEPHPTMPRNRYIRVFVEDDSNWHEKVGFSSRWLPELIELLQKVAAENGSGQ